jgi:hypothetical protein
MPADLWDNSTGHTQVATLMATDSLDIKPLNMSRIDRNVLLLRGYHINRSDASNGQFGVESFQDVFLKWQQAQPAGGASNVPIAAIVAPIVVAAALAALAAAMFVVWRRRKAAAAAAAAGATHSSGGKGELLPRVFADASRYSTEDKLCRNDSDTGSSPDSAVLAARSADQMRTHSNTSSLTSMSKAKSGPSQDIALACKNLVLHRTANEPDELILQSVLGEGSYGKVGAFLNSDLNFAVCSYSNNKVSLFWSFSDALATRSSRLFMAWQLAHLCRVAVAVKIMVLCMLSYTSAAILSLLWQSDTIYISCCCRCSRPPGRARLWQSRSWCCPAT